MRGRKKNGAKTNHFGMSSPSLGNCFSQSSFMYFLNGLLLHQGLCKNLRLWLVKVNLKGQPHCIYAFCLLCYKRRNQETNLIQNHHLTAFKVPGFCPERMENKPLFSLSLSPSLPTFSGHSILHFNSLREKSITAEKSASQRKMFFLY